MDSDLNRRYARQQGRNILMGRAGVVRSSDDEISDTAFPYILVVKDSEP